ncbi:unnamed protein product [Cuscuta campestris]|uniref:Peptide deformylase n=2 Tax=Cuscuta sect. Cleistogrammica TaxID=1824901 RepID=A0A484MKR2_9ASTE|nr:hypothetical protein DM860_002996 [Cuscuta australis]VFQ89563.1 unnamed protein product [Cuscuta campestris]
MAGATLLHSSPYTLSSFVARRFSLQPGSYSRFHRFTSTSCRLSHSLRRNKPPRLAVLAQARRGFSSKFSSDEFASPDDLYIQEPLKIVEYPDPVLRAKNKMIGTFDENLKKLADEMFDVMYRTDGVGLSAPQVGKNVQVMVFNPVGVRGEGKEIVLVNPRVTRYSQKVLPYNEGCLSFPQIYADVERPDSVKVDAQDINGATFTVRFTRFPARVFQHEYDHLQGILFFDRMSDKVLDSIRKDLEALEKKYEDRIGLPSPEKINTRKSSPAAIGFGNS